MCSRQNSHSFCLVKWRHLICPSYLLDADFVHQLSSQEAMNAFSAICRKKLCGLVPIATSHYYYFEYCCYCRLAWFHDSMTFLFLLFFNWLEVIINYQLVGGVSILLDHCVDYYFQSNCWAYYQKLWSITTFTAMKSDFNSQNCFDSWGYDLHLTWAVCGTQDSTPLIWLLARLSTIDSHFLWS